MMAVGFVTAQYLYIWAQKIDDEGSTVLAAYPKVGQAWHLTWTSVIKMENTTLSKAPWSYLADSFHTSGDAHPMLNLYHSAASHGLANHFHEHHVGRGDECLHRYRQPCKL